MALGRIDDVPGVMQGVWCHNVEKALIPTCKTSLSYEILMLAGGHVPFGPLLLLVMFWIVNDPPVTMACDEGKKEPDGVICGIVNVKWIERMEGQMMVTSQRAMRSPSMVSWMQCVRPVVIYSLQLLPHRSVSSLHECDLLSFLNR